MFKFHINGKFFINVLCAVYYTLAFRTENAELLLFGVYLLLLLYDQSLRHKDVHKLPRFSYLQIVTSYMLEGSQVCNSKLNIFVQFKTPELTCRKTYCMRGRNYVIIDSVKRGKLIHNHKFPSLF